MARLRNLKKAQGLQPLGLEDRIMRSTYSTGALRGYDPRIESRTAFFSRAAIALATVGSFWCPSKSRKNR